MGKYWTIFKLAATETLRNYKGLVGLNLFLITCLLVFAHIWKMAAAKAGAAHLDPDLLLWYIALNEIVLIAIPDLHLGIEHDCRSGRLAYFLPRPISYIGSSFFEGLGVMSIQFASLTLVAFLFTWWKNGSMPFDGLALAVFIILGVFSCVLGLVFKMLVGISAFWLQEVGPFDWIWEKFLFALGGLILPLTVYPLWIQKVAYWTPFPSILGQRSALALDFSWFGVMEVAGWLFFWCVLSWGCLNLMYRRGLKILNLEGG